MSKIRRDVNKTVLTVVTEEMERSSDKANERKMATSQDLSISRVSKVYIQANYEQDKQIQQVISLLKNRNTTSISRLPAPWREKFNSFSLDSKGLLYMDGRLVIPKDMRSNMLSAIHFGHAGRDAMLKDAADLWWPKIHREIIEKAKNCAKCQRSVENLNCLQSQKKFGKLPKAENIKDEISLDFADFPKGAQKEKVSISIRGQ